MTDDESRTVMHTGAVASHHMRAALVNGGSHAVVSVHDSAVRDALCDRGAELLRWGGGGLLAVFASRRVALGAQVETRRRRSRREGGICGSSRAAPSSSR